MYNFKRGDRIIIDSLHLENHRNQPKTFYKLEKIQSTYGYLLVEKVDDRTGGVKIDGIGGSWGYKRFKKYGGTATNGKDHYSEIELF